MLRPTTNVRERLLIYGAPGSGKTRAACSWASMLALTESPARVWYLKTDKRADVDLSGWPEMQRNTEVFELAGRPWPEFRVAASKANSSATRDDLCVVDMINTPWTRVREYYIERTFGMDADEWLLEYDIHRRLKILELEAELAAIPEANTKARTDKEKEIAKTRKSSPYFSADFNWDSVKLNYARFMDAAVDSFPGHVLLLAPTDKVRRDGYAADDDATLARYGEVGMKPVAEKKIGHHVHVELFAYQAGGAWKMTTARKTTGPATDRGDVKGETVTDFVASYLLKFADWVID